MNRYINILIILNCLNIYGIVSEYNEYCERNGLCKKKSHRYIFYDINQPEGFNLRRDVYMRFAVFAHKLENSKDNFHSFKLVLPPWSNLYHWNTEHALLQIPWSYFFDLESLKRFAPVIEMYEFFDEIGPQYSNINIDEVYVLQHFKDMFEIGNFEDRMAIEPCTSSINTNFFYYKNISSNNIKCLSFHGKASDLEKVLRNSSSRTFLFDHAEVALHDWFGDKLYWQARRSMRFNKELVNIAREYRETYLNSSDEQDNTVRPEDWRDEKPTRSAIGGPYLSVHMRRRDFLRGRPKQVPSIKGALQQIKMLLKKLRLNSVFVATDAPETEFEQLRDLLIPDFEVFRYHPKPDVENKYGPGGIAIIEQIICSHARYFVGTHESTFTFRIQEEREIMGFPESSTFNRLCGDDKSIECEKPSIWKIVL